MAVETINFEDYCRELQQQGFKIIDKEGLKNALRDNVGRRLKKETLKKYVSRPAQNTKKTKEKPQIFHSLADLAALSSSAKETKKSKTKKNQTKEEPSPQKKTKKTVLNIKEKPLPSKDTKHYARQEPSPKKQENIPDQKEEKRSLEEQYAIPLKEWVDNDLDEEGAQKRNIRWETPEEQKLNITITPQPELEEKGDSGAAVSIETAEESPVVNMQIAPLNEHPLSYEYFYQLLKTAQSNGIETVSFIDIKTEAFRTGLLAAALELNLKLKNEPKGIDLTTEYATQLPKKVKNRLRQYNQQNNRTIKGEEIQKKTNQLIERKNNINSKKTPSSSRSFNRKKKSRTPLKNQGQEME